MTDRLDWLATMGTMHRLLHQYREAENYFKQIITIQEQAGVEPSYYPIGQLYAEAGKYVKARPYLYKVLARTNRQTSMRALGHLHYLLFLADSASGDYLGAIRHLSKNKRYDDTLMQQSKVEAIQKYSIEFETERKKAMLREKDKEIALLTTEKKLKEMYAQRLRLIQVTTMAGIAIVIIAGLLFSREYRRKKKDRDTIARMNEALQQSLVEKEWLLKEVHHRVKNNLHTIICLLESQAMYLEKDALRAIEQSQHRIYAMSLIHQKLYQHDDIRSIDISLYLQEFTGYLIDSFDARHIRLSIDVDPIHLPIQQAVPVALIINEAVTNSIKHAFTGISDPEVFISMKKKGEEITLYIADNGKGIDAPPPVESKSLGMQLIRGLSKELKGTLTVLTDRGTALTIRFKEQPIVVTPLELTSL